MSGLEVEEIEEVRPQFTNIITARIEKIAEKMKEKRAELKKVVDALSLKACNESLNKRICELQQRQESIAADIRTAGGMRSMAADLYAALVDDCTEKINSKFEFVTWRMFQKLKNGSYSECCKAVVEGVSFSSLNSAARINCGIDVSNAFSRYKGVAVPMFVDNRESVNTIIQPEGQLVNIRVTPKGTPLRFS